MRRRMQKAAALLGLAGMLTWSLGFRADAVEYDKTDCSLTVTLSEQNTDDAESIDAADLPDVTYDLYQVADLLAVDGYDTFTYQTIPEITLSKEHDISDYSVLQKINDGTTLWDWTDIAAEIGDQVLAEDFEVEPVQSQAADAKGTASFEKVGTGLYLLIARGTGLEKADYVTETESGLAAVSYSERYAYTIAPQLISLPTKEGGSTAQSAGEWDYAPAVNLKWARAERYGSLRITKDLQSYDTASPVTFVFRVNAELDGEQVYSNVFARTFTAAGTQEILVEDKIPVGAVATVTELANTAYDCTNAEQSVVIGEGTAERADEMPVVEVTFENNYNGSTVYGYGIENGFTYTNGQWSWAKDGVTVTQ